MNVCQFFEYPEIQLPMRHDPPGQNDYQAFIKAKLDKFQSLVDQLSEPRSLVQLLAQERQAISRFCQAANDAVGSALRGQPSEAYLAFDLGMKELGPDLRQIQFKELDRKEPVMFYRVRRQITPPLTREQLFHIPFEERHKAAMQRYSIPGLPCLYLSGSLYTCWMEMGSPPFHELQASAFWVKEGQSFRVIDFTFRPARLLRYSFKKGVYRPEPPDLEAQLVTHIVMWPLTALCSIIVRHRDASFKCEYIVPQLLLQWVAKEQQSDGVCYFSTHVKAVPNRASPVCNLVIPARDIKPTGRCSFLRSVFKMTEPQSWELLSAVHTGRMMPGSAVPRYLPFEFIEGQEENYADTGFGNVEIKLNRLALDCDFMSRNGKPDLGDVLE